MTRLIGIYGASGFGREVMAVARTQFANQGVEFVFVDDHPSSAKVNGHDVMSFDDFCSKPADKRQVAIAIADAKIREKLAGRCREAGVCQYEVCADNVFLGDRVAIDEGAILQPFVTLTGNITIGRHFHANIYSYVAHDCVIGNFVTFAPSVRCNGNVHVHDHAYIGSGAILRQGTPNKPLTIGAGAVIGMGAVVTKDVAPGVTVIGNPARPLVKE
jgi:hypothetical protein